LKQYCLIALSYAIDSILLFPPYLLNSPYKFLCLFRDLYIDFFKASSFT
jgi:hypothetical protein